MREVIIELLILIVASVTVAAIIFPLVERFGLFGASGNCDAPARRSTIQR